MENGHSLPYYYKAPPGLDATTGTRLGKNNSARTPPATGRTDLICGHLEGLQDFILIHYLERRALIQGFLRGDIFGDGLSNRQVSHGIRLSLLSGS